jgi:hypothetical protein
MQSKGISMFKKTLSITCILVGLLLASSAQAASTLTLLSYGNSAYQLQGAAVAGAAGLDITLSYDPSVLAAPQVAQGPLLSGAMVAVNPNTPGTVRISAVTLSPLTGSGILFTITFTRVTDGQGIRSLAARLIDLKGNPLASQVQLAVSAGTSGTASTASPSDTASRPETASGSVSAPTGTVSGGGLIGIMMVPPPAVPPVAPEDRKPGAGQEPVEPKNEGGLPEPAPVQTAKAGPQARSMPIYTQESILDRFRDFSGKRTMKAYLALFDQEPLIGFRQEPPIVLSDGVSTATVHFISTPEREHTSDLAVIGAKLIAAKRDPDSTNTWIVTVLPEKGSTNVTLAVTQKNVLMVDPLTVASRVDADLDRSGTVNEADFALFLRERGTAKAPAFDLNRDGVRDFRDDFIFTANYLVARQKDAGRPKDTGKPAAPPGRSSGDQPVPSALR